MTTLEQLRREVKAAWNQACAADGIKPDAKFVVFTNTTEAALYNELMGLYLRARRQEIRDLRPVRGTQQRHTRRQAVRS